MDMYDLVILTSTFDLHLKKLEHTFADGNTTKVSDISQLWPLVQGDKNSISKGASFKEYYLMAQVFLEVVFWANDYKAK